MNRVILSAGLSAALLGGEAAKPSVAEAEAPANRTAASSWAAAPCARQNGDQA